MYFTENIKHNFPTSDTDVSLISIGSKTCFDVSSSIIFGTDLRNEATRVPLKVTHMLSSTRHNHRYLLV